MVTRTSPTLAPAPQSDAERLTRWSYAMLLAFVLAYAVAGVVGYWLLGALGLNDGDLLLMDRSVVGWVTEVGLTLVLLAPPAVGIALAIRAVRAGARTLAFVAAALNGSLVLIALVTLVGNIWITYVRG
ncbi:MAG TPA: hypothetical protein VFL94_12810 [Actinomycetales bacterium]|jgi:hypothetical protein|nr:hypothetical protein [Actinomycetales bacterium]